jgi:hypothetical protein
MPEICRFYGIAVFMYYKEHQPPHFHAVYGGREALISIETLSVLAGSLPPRSLGLVIEWASIHGNELGVVWNQAMNHQKLDKIDPLE